MNISGEDMERICEAIISGCRFGNKVIDTFFAPYKEEYSRRMEIILKNDSFTAEQKLVLINQVGKEYEQKRGNLLLGLTAMTALPLFLFDIGATSTAVKALTEKPIKYLS